MSDEPINPLLLQAFAWDLPADCAHWRLLADNASLLADCGVTSAWLPPAYKGRAGAEDVGYGVYDTYDLGEFDQKGSVATKYGTKDDYLAAVGALHAAGIAVVADIVLNHRMGADSTEVVRATPMDPADRRRPIGPAEEITAWTRFTFPGRAEAHSDFTWDWTCFHGTDWDESRHLAGVWLFEGKQWNDHVTDELGNYDYLMGADVHATDPRVAAELDRWGRWYVEATGVDGLRLDALKHVGADFFARWLLELRRATGRDLPAVGEYWSRDVAELERYLEAVPSTSLFDVPLHFRLHAASTSNGDMDLSRLFEGTLVGADPARAVTFVENHDTQPGQSLASTVLPWFKPSAYALILLREAGTPCVFWGDLFGTPETGDLPAVTELPLLMTMRRALAHGPQHDALDEPDIVGFAREGDAAHPGSGLAVVLSDRRAGSKRLDVGARHAGRRWVCVLGGHEPVTVGEDGAVELAVSDGGLSVYAPESARPLLDDAEYRLLRQR
ncbi:alpha-amylase [Actinomyces israelii]|uniref:alpha-amylase n=1 Tax=Actinomyces israelii TaxID=1659 RepID=UPI002356D53E|nr:alpha-amylase [Actinomyces israelii]